MLDSQYSRTQHFDSSAPPELIADLLKKADIALNGHRPWDIHVHHPDTFRRILAQRSLGLGESYMDGWWDCRDLEEFFFRLIRTRGDRLARPVGQIALQWLDATLRNRQSPRRARQVAHTHYDLDNHLFEVMLDDSMAYSCGYWHNAANLHEAQMAKFDLICRKLELRPGMKVLDVGCGWGGFMEFAAREYGVRGDGITVSVEQAALARERCTGLPVNILVRDWRQQRGQYDRIISIGMFEHVGRRNYAAFMSLCARLLKQDGMMLLHTIGSNETRHSYDPWINRYIFPNGELPSMAQISQAAEKHFVTEDVHNFGPDYARTLRAWDANFTRGWDRLRERYDERFFRMWRYYLNACAGAFRARGMQLWQWVFTHPGGRLDAYRAPR